MAHPRVVAVRRQNADKRLQRVAAVAASKFGVTFTPPKTLPNRHPDLYSAELIERVADFIEGIIGAEAPKQRRAS